jgi:CheY-like chemotaxis protein
MKRPKKILSVDDDPLNRDILMEYLTDGGYDVIEADDGDTALKLRHRGWGLLLSY